jgi:hypothetical protein
MGSHAARFFGNGPNYTVLSGPVRHSLIKAQRSIRGMNIMSESEIEACRVVENLLRSLGGKCVQVSIMRDLVEIAPVEWAGGSTGKTLADAINDALKQN